jgi:FtsP/CotA-like multicopper oxidase with cupredoxin domain
MIFANLVINGQVVEMRTYNGSFPGPTLVVRPGDKRPFRNIYNNATSALKLNRIVVTSRPSL